MILGINKRNRQVSAKAIWLLLLPAFFACAPQKDIKPPVTAPLSRTVLGYGVVNVSYTQVLNEPGSDGISIGFVREKTILTILERRLIKENEAQQYWVLSEGTYRGWLPESVINLYDTEGKAETAASN